MMGFNMIVGHPYGEYNNTHLFLLHIPICIHIQHNKGKYLLQKNGIQYDCWYSL